MPENILQLLIIIVSGVISIAGGYSIKYLKSKVESENLNQYYSLVKTIIMSIEQTQGSLSGEEKKKLAVEKIKELTNGKLKEEQIDRLIEAVVYEVKKVISNNLK